MTFKLNLSQTYFTPVVVEIPIDGGRSEKMTFDAEFRRIGRAELDRLMESAGKKKKSDQEVIDEVLVGWKGVKDHNNSDVEFSETSKKAVFDIVQVLPALVKAFFESISGVREKN